MDEQQLKSLFRNYREMRRRISEIDALDAVARAAGSAAQRPIEIPYFDDSGTINLSCGKTAVMPDALGLDDAIIARNASEKEGLVIIADLLEGLVACLEAPEREVMQALYVDGLTYDEAAEAVDISRATVSCRRNRAITKICRMMNQGRRWTK